jgi:hypothetical protein
MWVSAASSAVLARRHTNNVADHAGLPAHSGSSAPSTLDPSYV